MKPHDEWGDLMTMEEFIETCKSGSFIDHDGHGLLATETHRSGNYIYPSQVLSGDYDKSFTHVVWYNR